MKQLILGICSIFFAFAGCATATPETEPGTGPQAVVVNPVESEPGLEPGLRAVAGAGVVAGEAALLENPYLTNLVMDPAEGAEPEAMQNFYSCGDAVIHIGKPFHVCCAKNCQQCKVAPGPGCMGGCCAPAIRNSPGVPQCTGNYFPNVVPCKLPLPPH